MKLEFVERRPEYSIYKDRKGNLRYLVDAELVNSTNPPLYTIDADTLFPRRSTNNAPLYAEWSKRARRGMSKEEFLAFLQAVLTDPAKADGVGWCSHCDTIDATSLGGARYGKDNTEFACSGCVRYVKTCSHCQNQTINAEMIHRRVVCRACRDEHYTLCRQCGVWADNEVFARDHRHGNGCCESPQPEFSVRLLDNPAMANDVKTVVTVGAGQIDQAGLKRLTDWLNGAGYYHEAAVIPALDPTWQKKDGNFPKRFSKAVYKTYRRKVNADVMAMVGTIGAEHSGKGSEVTVMITRQLNNPAEFFANSGSCWWGSAHASRCALKTNGGFGLLTYASPRHTKPTGRAWVLPVMKDGTKMRPTFETMEPDGFVVFNGYGSMADYAGARIMAGLAGMTYRKIAFGNQNPIYVNSGGYLIGSEEFVDPYTDGYIYMDVMAQHAKLFEAERKELEKRAAIRAKAEVIDLVAAANAKGAKVNVVA